MSVHHPHSHDHGSGQYRFCPRCGAPLELRHVKDGEPKRPVCQGCGFIFYLDPKVVAGAVFTLQGRVVLLRRGIEPALGKWVFPGGYVDRGETVTDAAIRETREECHLEVTISSLLGVYSYPLDPNVIVVYASQICGGKLGAGDEMVEAQTFKGSEIPWDELAFVSTRDALRDYLRLHPVSH